MTSEPRIYSFFLQEKKTKIKIDAQVCVLRYAASERVLLKALSKPFSKC